MPPSLGGRSHLLPSKPFSCAGLLPNESCTWLLPFSSSLLLRQTLHAPPSSSKRTRPSSCSRIGSRKPGRGSNPGVDPSKSPSSLPTPLQGGAGGKAAATGEDPVIHVVEPNGGGPRETQRSHRIRQAYRKKSLTDEEWKVKRAREREETARFEEEVLHGGGLAPLLPSPSSASPRMPKVLLVDGYNILHTCPQLRLLLPGVRPATDLAFARGELERRVMAYAAAAGVDVLVVYDAMGWKGWRPPNEEPREEPLDSRVTIVFSLRSEADSYIVWRAQQLKAEGRTRIELVSKDRRIEMESMDFKDFTIYAIDPNRFIKDLEDCVTGKADGVRARRSYSVTPGSTVPHHSSEQSRLAASAEARWQASRQGKLPGVVPSRNEERDLLENLERISGTFDDEEEWEEEEVWEEEGQIKSAQGRTRDVVQGREGGGGLMRGDQEEIQKPFPLLPDDDDELSRDLNNLFG